MRELTELVSPLREDLVKALADIGIRADYDLIFAGPISKFFKRLPPGLIDPHSLARLVTDVVTQAAASPVQGDMLLTLENKRLEDTFHGVSVGCGVAELDELAGGFAGSRVIEIAGDRGSGKTVLALQIVMRHLSAVHDSAAIWIDTTGDFSGERVTALLESCSGPAADSSLERLQVALAFDVEAAEEVLEALRASLAADQEQPLVVRYLVLDTISTLMRPILSATSSRGHAVMTSFMRKLHDLAETFSMTILVINQSSSSSPWTNDSARTMATRKPALGPSFTFLTESTLWLARREADVDVMEEEGCTEHVAELLRSRSKPSRSSCAFQIRQGAIGKG